MQTGLSGGHRRTVNKVEIPAAEKTFTFSTKTRYWGMKAQASVLYLMLPEVRYDGQESHLPVGSVMKISSHSLFRYSVIGISEVI